MNFHTCVSIVEFYNYSYSDTHIIIIPKESDGMKLCEPGTTHSLSAPPGVVNILFAHDPAMRRQNIQFS